MCDHDWQPIPGWCARYRCSICLVIGCKFGVLNEHLRRRGVGIEPYRCEARCNGERCNAPAVHAWKGRGFRCAEHHHRCRTTRARAQLGTSVATNDSVLTSVAYARAAPSADVAPDR